MGRASKINGKWTTKKVATKIHHTVGLNENEIRNLYEEFQSIARPRVQFVSNRLFSYVIKFMIGYSTLNSMRQQKQADVIDPSMYIQRRCTYLPVPSPFPPNFNFFRNTEHSVNTEQRVNRNRQQAFNERSHYPSEQSHHSGTSSSEIVEECEEDEYSEDSDNENEEKLDVVDSDDENEDDLEMIETRTANAVSTKGSDDENVKDLEMEETITAGAESNNEDENEEILEAEIEPGNIAQSEPVELQDQNGISEQLPCGEELHLVSEEGISSADANEHNIIDEERNLQEMLLHEDLQAANDEERQAERGLDGIVIPHLIDPDINLRVLRLLEQHTHEVTTHNFFVQPPSTEHPVKSIFTKSRIYKIDEPILNIKEAEIKMREHVEDIKESNVETEVKESNAYMESDESDGLLSLEHATDEICDHNLQPNTEETANNGAEDNVSSDEPQESDNEIE